MYSSTMIKQPYRRRYEVRIDWRMKRAMQLYDDVDWATLTRKAIQREINRLDKERK